MRVAIISTGDGRTALNRPHTRTHMVFGSSAMIEEQLGRRRNGQAPRVLGAY
jgi:hypothetical protein